MRRIYTYKWFFYIFSFIWGLIGTGCNTQSVETVVIRGSDTEVNLVLQLAENYMDNHQNISIAVTGGGSGTGIAAFINHRTDIANSSRAFSKAELAMAKERGLKVVPIIFAMDALCFIVHKDSPLESLSLEQIKGIYTGKIQNWQEVGGKNLTVSLYGRQSNSGTFTFIQKNILQADYSQSMKQMNGTSQIVESLKNDIAGIGYVGIGYVVNKEGNVLEGIKIIKIRSDNNSPAIDPTHIENISNGTYPIVRPLYQYLNGKPSGLLKDFILYELSPKGQKVITEGGYFPINETQKQENLKYLQ